MNTRNDTVLPQEWDADYALIEEQDIWITLVASALYFGFLGMFDWYEAKKNRLLLSPVNALLFAMIASNCLIVVFTQLYSVCYEANKIAIYISLSYFFFGVYDGREACPWSE
ncbi:hypothetical protein BCR33DRAFT_723110 [Rhizoclosmatium globosum]|uniref:Uncharacterized protein n=1 Tax=Rhizoclosmatium globosum TaxID=329046 RepID=A0A1Y2BH49_9FUNG|nr:hypothetical protein BCR33DRAFT_723110 [Rhizoclosmatium globosum]|eukprot:ORY33900.1 hypothetical protein BCR33DRAFT_723110 [Rhizoclosmatium globosum]